MILHELLVNCEICNFETYNCAQYVSCIHFPGGEPFIVERGRYVGELVRFCKRDLGMESVTLVSNGSLIKEKWFEEYGSYLDIMAISCDSSEPDTLKAIGR